MMGCRVRKFLSWLLILGAIALSIALGLGLFNPPSAAAAIRQLEEAPGQMVYQSRATLKDQHGSGWQAIAFKRVRPDGQTSIELRLVGFPGVAVLDRSQPLTLTNSLGKILTAPDASSAIFGEAKPPEPNVGQYDLLPLLSQLQAEVPLQLTLRIVDTEPITLSVSPSLLQEWQILAQDS
ncbi:MAG: DUF3122 domain-containing protein [Kovacikia sp.]